MWAVLCAAVELRTQVAVAADGTLLHRAAPAHCDRDMPVCTVDGATVYRCGRERRLRFGQESGVESHAWCADSPPCTDDCSCACDFDASEPLTGSAAGLRAGVAALCSSGEAARVLLVGLGGGVLPLHLAHDCPQLAIEAVELSAAVIDLATRFFGLGAAIGKYGARLAVEQGDGLEVLQRKPAGAYAAVIVDCFVSNGIVPKSCRSEAFAASALRALRPGGRLVQNLWHKSDYAPQVAGEYVATLATYRAAFGSVVATPAQMPPGVPHWVDIVVATKPE